MCRLRVLYLKWISYDLNPADLLRVLVAGFEIISCEPNSQNISALLGWVLAIHFGYLVGGKGFFQRLFRDNVPAKKSWLSDQKFFYIF